MSQLRAKSKLNGLYVLRGSWIKAIIIFLILALLSFGISGINQAYRTVFNIPQNLPDGSINCDVRSFIVQAVFTLITLFVMVPLALGMLEWFWNLTDGKKMDVGGVFAWYGSGRLYGKSLLLGFDIGIRSLFWGILTCGAPLAMLIGANYYYYASGINHKQENLSAIDVQKLFIVGILLIFGILLLLGGILLYIFITSRYIIAPFLMVEDNSRKVSAVVKDSIKYSRKYRWEFTKFILSFVGWAFVCIAVLPLLYVVPYFCSSLSIFSKHIIYAQRPQQKNGDTIQFSAPGS